MKPRAGLHVYRSQNPIDNVTWYAPDTLEGLLKLRRQFGAKGKLVGGNTEIGIEVRILRKKYPIMISTKQVAELTTVRTLPDCLEVGGAATLTDLQNKIRNECSILPKWKSRTFNAVLQMLRWFASNQIRNVATLAGTSVFRKIKISTHTALNCIAIYFSINANVNLNLN